MQPNRMPNLTNWTSSQGFLAMIPATQDAILGPQTSKAIAVAEAMLIIHPKVQVCEPRHSHCFLDDFLTFPNVSTPYATNPLFNSMLRGSTVAITQLILNQFPRHPNYGYNLNFKICTMCPLDVAFIIIYNEDVRQPY
jgi:hypothetical protein